MTSPAGTAERPPKASAAASDARPARRFRRIVVLSDVHLSQTHPEDPSDPLWMRYRRADLHPDAELAALVDHFLAAHPGDAFELVFNGDLFDFDAPWVKDGTSSFDEFPLDEAGCTAQVERILADHEAWFSAVARLVAAGHRVLFTSGNHDVELYWPGVRRAIAGHIGRLAETPIAPGELAERVRFRAWFHVTEDRIYLEHGSQYDVMNGVRHAMLPVTKDGTRIHPMFGKLAFKRTGSRMGYFNPYYEETFYMGLFGYLGHFLRRYAFSRRSIVVTWALGGLRTCLEIWRHRHDDDRAEAGRELARAETGATDAQIDATHALRVRPAEDTMLPIVRELWLDRVALALVAAGVVGAVVSAFGPRAAAITAVVLVVLFVVYELVTPKPDIRTYDSAPPSVRALFDIHDVRALCMGHTHRPWGVWDASARGEPRFHGNSGTWAPAFHDAECRRPVLDGRPVLYLASEVLDEGEQGERPARYGELRGGLYWWRRGALVPDPEGARPIEQTDAFERAEA